MWVDAIWKGVLVGLGLCFVIGPVFFALIDASLRRGFKEGAKFALGIFSSDLIYASLFWLGVGKLLVQWGQSNWLAIVGGCILAGMGLKNLLQKPSKASLSPPDPNDATDRYGAIGKGFVLNTFNPGTSMVWLAAGTAGADLAAKGGLWLQGAYMATILATVLSTDLTKAYLAKKLKNHLTTRTIIYANRVAGAIMLVAGLVLIGVVVVKVF